MIEMCDRAPRLNALLGEAISAQYFTQTRFAGYSFDKLVCGLMDGHRLAGDKSAFGTLDKVTAAAAPVLPGHAVDRKVQWKVGSDGSWMWDETYTLPENLYLIARMKLSRYLLRATRDGHYGDSMEQVMLNTALGALPLQAEGRSFYYSD